MKDGATFLEDVESQGELPLNLPTQDVRTRLIEGGEVAGVFVNRMLAEQAHQFLARFNTKQGGAR